MTTTTQNPIKLIDEGAELLAAHPEPAIDFDTRLTLAGIGMDVRLSIVGGDALSEAHASVAEAIAAPVAPVETAPVFRSHPVLKAAGDVIRARGWHQGAFEGEDYAICAFQAVKIAANGNQWVEDAALGELLDRVHATTGEYGYSVPSYNDAPGRTREEVLALLT